MTKSQIRAQLLEREDVLRVKITRDGLIEAYVNIQRGDGGQSPWWMLVGTVDRAHEIAWLQS